MDLLSWLLQQISSYSALELFVTVLVGVLCFQAGWYFKKEVYQNSLNLSSRNVDESERNVKLKDIQLVELQKILTTKDKTIKELEKFHKSTTKEFSILLEEAEKRLGALTLTVDGLKDYGDATMYPLVLGTIDSTLDIISNLEKRTLYFPLLLTRQILKGKYEKRDLYNFQDHIITLWQMLYKLHGTILTITTKIAHIINKHQPISVGEIEAIRTDLDMLLDDIANLDNAITHMWKKLE